MYLTNPTAPCGPITFIGLNNVNIVINDRIVNIVSNSNIANNMNNVNNISQIMTKYCVNANILLNIINNVNISSQPLGWESDPSFCTAGGISGSSRFPRFPKKLRGGELSGRENFRAATVVWNLHYFDVVPRSKSGIVLLVLQGGHLGSQGSWLSTRP